MVAGGDFIVVAAGKECDEVLYWMFLTMRTYLHGKCFYLLSYVSGSQDIKQQAHFLTTC